MENNKKNKTLNVSENADNIKKTDENKKEEDEKNSSGKSSSRKKRIPFAIVESYKNIRTTIAFLLSENDGNSFTVTSANAGEGKSTTSANLSVAFSQLGKKVLIIDADLRRASLHKKFQIENTMGLADVIVENTTFDEAVKSINSTLDILTAGTLPPNPSELLDSDKFTELMVYLNSVYDIVIVDTPPLNVVSDSLIVAPRTAGVVLIVRDGYTPHYSIKKAIEVMRFSNVNILGAVMNGANQKSKSKYVYRKSSYDTNSRYGYSNRYGGKSYGGYGYGNYGNYGGYGNGGYGYGGYGSYGGGYGGYGSYGDYSNNSQYDIGSPIVNLNNAVKDQSDKNNEE